MLDEKGIYTCPFCKSGDLGWTSHDIHDQVICRCCYARGPQSQDAEGAIYSWNQYIDQPDPFGRVWMHVDSGMNMSKESIYRFMKFCLSNNVELGSVYALQPEFPRSSVYASVRIHPDKIESFETEVKAKLRNPPKIRLN